MTPRRVRPGEATANHNSRTVHARTDRDGGRPRLVAEPGRNDRAEPAGGPAGGDDQQVVGIRDLHRAMRLDLLATPTGTA